jgi:hypothetical protein
MAGHISNGTMGAMWQARWCDNCQNDHACHTGAEEPDWENGCQLYVRVLFENCDDLPEILDEEPEDSRGWSPDYLVCRMFTPCQSCRPGGEDDRPTSFDPGPDHGRLFEVIDETPFTPMVIIAKTKWYPGVAA